MPRFRERLESDTIYTDHDSAFITADGVGGTWGQGDDPVAHLKEEFGEETPTEEVSKAFMKAIYNDYDEPEGYDPDDEEGEYA